MDHTLEKILARVQKPGRYVGGEYNAVPKRQKHRGLSVRLLLSRHL